MNEDLDSACNQTPCIFDCISGLRLRLLTQKSYGFMYTIAYLCFDYVKAVYEHPVCKYTILNCILSIITRSLQDHQTFIDTIAVLIM